MNLTKTTPALKQDEIKRDWHLFDAKGKILGRFVTDIAQVLIGKHKRNFTPNMDSGDNVVVINAQGIKVTGRKENQKVYKSYSGYPGGLKEITYDRLKAKDPTKIIQNAATGMLPKNKHRKQRMTRLHVYRDKEHPFKDKFNQ